MRDYTVYVPVPERLEGKDGFTDLAINLSERYQYDVDIFDHGNEIEVIFYFELFAYLSELKELLILADKIVVECDSTKENSLKVILEYYTHEQYFNGKAKRNIIWKNYFKTMLSRNGRHCFLFFFLTFFNYFKKSDIL